MPNAASMKIFLTGRIKVIENNMANEEMPRVISGWLSVAMAEILSLKYQYFMVS